MNRGATDEQLLAKFVGGDRAPLGELAQRYERPLLGMAMGLLGGQRSLACDAVQETWLRVIRFAGGFNGVDCDDYQPFRTAFFNSSGYWPTMDISEFFAALLDPASDEGDPCIADLDVGGYADGNDIQAFVQALLGG